MQRVSCQRLYYGQLAIINCSKANQFYFIISISFIYLLNIRGKYCIEYRSQVCCDKVVRKSVGVENVFLTEILVTFRQFVTSTAFATFLLKVISGTIDKSRVFFVDFVSAAIISTDANLILDIYPDLIKTGLLHNKYNCK